MNHSRCFRVAALLGAAISAASQPKPLSSFDAQVKPLLARMTLAEKIGQMTQPDQESIKDLADIETYFVGSILSGGTSDPKEGNSLKAWTDLYDRLQQHTANTRLRIPILYGIDAVHWAQQRAGRGHLPAEYRDGLHSQPRAVEKNGASNGRGSSRHRHPVGVCAVRHGAAG